MIKKFNTDWQFLEYCAAPGGSRFYLLIIHLLAHNNLANATPYAQARKIENSGLKGPEGR